LAVYAGTDATRTLEERQPERIRKAMPDWDRIFSDMAPEMLEGALQLGEKLGGPGYRWQVSGYFLNWSIPWYMAAIRNALGRNAVKELMPEFLNQMRRQVQNRAMVEPGFPADEFLGLLDELGEQGMDELIGRGLPEGAEGTALADTSPEALAAMENHLAETAYNIVRVAFGVGKNQFAGALAGEAATWILAVASSSFLRGLGVGLGENAASRFHPGFFSRLRHELREQYEEIPDYPLSHFLNIVGSIGKKWLRLSVESDPADSRED
jgi:hypothetical protein